MSTAPMTSERYPELEGGRGPTVRGTMWRAGLMRIVLLPSVFMETLRWGAFVAVMVVSASARGAPSSRSPSPRSRAGAKRCRLERVGRKGVFVDAIQVEGSLAKSLHRRRRTAGEKKVEEKAPRVVEKRRLSYCAPLRGAWAWRRQCQEALRQAILRCLGSSLERNGHYTPNLQVHFQRRGAALDVVVEGKAGPRYVVGALDVSGAGISQKLRLLLLGKVVTRSGHGFSRGVLREDVGTLESHFRAQGYAYAIVVLETNKDTKLRRVDVEFHVFKGPRVRVFELRIQGASPSGRLLIKRAIPLKRGAFYEGDKLQQAMERLRATGAFKRVSMDVCPWNVAGAVYLRVRVEERSFSLRPRPAARRGGGSPSKDAPRP